MTEVSLIVYKVADLTKAKPFFREIIGAEPYVDSSRYVGYKCGDVEIGLVPSERKGEAHALAYWTVSDIAATVRALEAVGGSVVQEVTDVASGLLVASVKVPNGAIVGLRQPPRS